MKDSKNKQEPRGKRQPKQNLPNVSLTRRSRSVRPRYSIGDCDNVFDIKDTEQDLIDASNISDNFKHSPNREFQKLSLEQRFQSDRLFSMPLRQSFMQLDRSCSVSNETDNSKLTQALGESKWLSYRSGPNQEPRTPVTLIKTSNDTQKVLPGARMLDDLLEPKRPNDTLCHQKLILEERQEHPKLPAEMIISSREERISSPPQQVKAPLHNFSQFDYRTLKNRGERVIPIKMPFRESYAEHKEPLAQTYTEDTRKINTQQNLDNCTSITKNNPDLSMKFQMDKSSIIRKTMEPYFERVSPESLQSSHINQNSSYQNRSSVIFQDVNGSSSVCKQNGCSQPDQSSHSHLTKPTDSRTISGSRSNYNSLEQNLYKSFTGSHNALVKGDKNQPYSARILSSTFRTPQRFSKAPSDPNKLRNQHSTSTSDAVRSTQAYSTPGRKLSDSADWTASKISLLRSSRFSPTRGRDLNSQRGTVNFLEDANNSIMNYFSHQEVYLLFL